MHPGPLLKRFLILPAILSFFITSVSAETFFIKRISDGDTIVLTNGDRVRLIGIDTPESANNAKARKDSVRTQQDLAAIIEMGKEAKNFLRDLIQSRNIKEIVIEYDFDKFDRYGRHLAYIYFLTCPKAAMCKPSPEYFYEVEKENGSYLFVNATMIKSGYAQPMTIPPNVKYAHLFKELYEEAREKQIGLWDPGINRSLGLKNFASSDE